MTYKLMISTNNDTQNYPFCTLQLMVETFEHSTNELTHQNSLTVLKVINSTNKKTLF